VGPIPIAIRTAAAIRLNDCKNNIRTRAVTAFKNDVIRAAGVADVSLQTQTIGLCRWRIWSICQPSLAEGAEFRSRDENMSSFTEFAEIQSINQSFLY